MSRSYERFLPDIEKKLEGLIAAENSAAEAMSYSLLSGGKRIRPILLLEFYRLFGRQDGNALNFAAIVLDAFQGASRGFAGIDCGNQQKRILSLNHGH